MKCRLFEAVISICKGLGLWIARRRRVSALAEGLCFLSRTLYRSCENENYDAKQNGELRVIEKLRDRNFDILFDVGANIGEWTRDARRIFPHSDIYSFEVIPSTFDELESRISVSQYVHLINKGLSDQAGTLSFEVSQASSQLASGVSIVAADATATIQCMVEKGDDFCVDSDIKAIQFLKLDVEGMEDKVLSGFREMLEKGAIDIIQFEYGMVNIASRFLLRDFYFFLEPYGYSIGKIYPHLVDFREYDYVHENFVGGNYLAVRKELNDIIQLLGYSEGT